MLGFLFVFASLGLVWLFFSFVGFLDEFKLHKKKKMHSVKLTKSYQIGYKWPHLVTFEYLSCIGSISSSDIPF